MLINKETEERLRKEYVDLANKQVDAILEIVKKLNKTFPDLSDIQQSEIIQSILNGIVEEQKAYTDKIKDSALSKMNDPQFVSTMREKYKEQGDSNE